MRLFIALQFEDSILDEFVEYQKRLRSCGVAGNYTRRENLHITLAFIGEYGNSSAILDAMEVADFEAMTVCFSGFGIFRDLFWVGIDDNPALDMYVKQLRRELACRGIPYDRKRFNPHITLVRRFKNHNDVALPHIEIPTETVKRVSLMKSVRGKHGMIYTEIGGIEA